MIAQQPHVASPGSAGVSQTTNCQSGGGAGDGGIIVALLTAVAAAILCSFRSGLSSNRCRCCCLTSGRRTLTMFMMFSVAPPRNAFSAHSTDHTTDHSPASLLFDHTSSSVSSLYSKMVADETLIKSNRRLSEKIPLQQTQTQYSSYPPSSPESEGHSKAEYGSYNTTLAASIVLGSCCCGCNPSYTSFHDNNHEGDHVPKRGSVFQFTLGSGQGRGMVCVPIPSLPEMDDLQGDSWYSPKDEKQPQKSSLAGAWPLFLVPRIDLAMAPGSEGYIEYSVSSSYVEKSASWWIRNCFGLSDQEESIGFPFEYNQVPPQGAMVQLSCGRRSTGGNRLNQDNERRQGSNDTCLDFVIILLDEDDDIAAPHLEGAEQNSHRNVIVESQVAQIVIVEEQEHHAVEEPPSRSQTNLRIRSNHNHHEATQPPPQQRTKQVTLIRPILMDSKSTIRGIRVEAFEVSSWSSTSSVSYQSSRSSPWAEDDENANRSSRSSSLPTIDPTPPQYHHHSKHNPLIHVQTSNIIQRVLDGQHDNVLAITLPTDYDFSSENSFQGKGEESSNSSSTNTFSQDTVVLVHYEMETIHGEIYQRTHIVSSHHPPSSAPSRRPFDDLTWFPSLGPALRPRPVWIESTQVTVDGDVRVTLAGLSSLSSSSLAPPTTSSTRTEEKNCRDSHLRRLLCTIRVGLIVEDIEPDEEKNVGAEAQLHSVVDIAGMVTSDAPILMVHVGWIRKGLEALQLSFPESNNSRGQSEPWSTARGGWDVHIEDVLCQDPNHGYQVTYTLQEEGEEEAALNATRGGPYHRDLRRRLFARLRDHRNNRAEEDANSNHERGNNSSVARKIAAALRLMSRVPTQEERDVHDEMRMGRRPEVSWSKPKGDQDKEQEHSEEVGSNRSYTPHYNDTVRRLVGALLPKKEGPQPQQEPEVHRFILTHGYCALNTWPQEDFTGKGYTVVRFEDPYQSKSHDDYAFALRERACPYREEDSQMIVSGNVVAHSQGGAAALHLQNFYWSCLDNNPYTGHRIQTLGTPFQGTNLAGVAATLGAIFGLGCNSVHDLTQEGATEWLSHIQPWARQRVIFYRTQYREHAGNNHKDYCHLLTHAIIGAPNDGVVQVGRGILPGGIDGGVKMTQCHVLGMRDPPQVEDSSRNYYMKQVAAVPPQ